MAQTCHKRPHSSMSESSSDFPPSPDSLDMEFDDPNLTNAMMEATRTNTVTPIIKQEIRYAIQNKRLAKGKEELVVSLEPKMEREELSPEDMDRRRQRRERNRVAAQKCRMKRKVQADGLVEESRKLEIKNKDLHKTINKLEEERNRLMDILKCHTPFCQDQPLCAEDSLITSLFLSKPRLDSTGTNSNSFEDFSDSETSTVSGSTETTQGNFLTIDMCDFF